MSGRLQNFFACRAHINISHANFFMPHRNMLMAKSDINPKIWSKFVGKDSNSDFENSDSSELFRHKSALASYLCSKGLCYRNFCGTNLLLNLRNFANDQEESWHNFFWSWRMPDVFIGWAGRQHSVVSRFFCLLGNVDRGNERRSLCCYFGTVNNL